VPLLLRKIRKSKWYKNDSVPWLEEGEIQADALGDLVTSGNTLSIWLVEDDKSNLEQVIVALVSSCDNISNFDYALINVDLLLSVGIKIDTKEGLTPYLRANQWHRDLVELTTNKLFKLAEVMAIHSTRERVSEKTVLNLIRAAVQNEKIDKTKLKEGVIKRLG
jgi:hypothetical protein